MRNMKRLAALALALAMCVPASAFAAETAGGEGVSSVSSPGTGSAPVELTADASNMDVTVPTGVAIYIHADGMVSTPEEPAYITNNGPGPVRVAGISASAVGGWELVDWDADMPIGSKKLALKVAQTAFAADGSYDMEYMNGWWDGCNPMAGNGGRIEQVWEAQASLQKTAVAVTEVAKVVYTLAADKVEATGFSTDAEVFYNAPGDKIGHFIGDPGEVTVSIAGLSSSQFSWTLGSEESWGTDLFLTIDADAAKENLVSPFGVTVSWTGNGGGSATVQVSNNVYNPHVHNWATAWSSDAQYHWHNCLADGCPIGDKFGKDGMGSHVAVTDAAVAPTLTTTGLTEGSHCKTCGYVIKAQTVVPKLDKPASLSFTVSTGGVSVNGSMSNVYGWNYAGVATFSNHPAADTSTTHTVVFRPEAFPKGFLITSVVAQRKDSSNIKVEYSNNGDGTWIGSHGHYMGASTEIYGYNWTYVVTLEKKIDVPLTGLQVELPVTT